MRRESQLHSTATGAILSAAGIDLPASAFTPQGGQLGGESGPRIRNLSRRTHEDSFCSIVRRAHARKRLRVRLSLPDGHEEDRRGDGEESEAVCATIRRSPEITRRRWNASPSVPAPRIPP